MTWQPLSKRIAGQSSDGPYDGVPAHLLSGVLHWFRGLCHSGPNGRIEEVRLHHVVAYLRFPVGVADGAETILDALIAKASSDEEFCLDLLDAGLHVWEDWNRWRALDAILSAGGSIWKVESVNHTSITRVVGDQVQAAFNAAVTVEDDISAELGEAWSNAFGRNGDPSDAWDHSIKALEEVLIPVVVPNQSKPNLGHVVGQLRNQGHLWQMVIPGKNQDHDVAPLVGMLDMIWPNHDRHGGGSSPKRTPSAEEARAVVTLAATIVQWHREGWAVRKR
ncbi:hypothetical protein [Mycobacteroides chelonae]|nr:hypothetical protein Chelonae_p4147 [Mycobacterium sp. QIA-37]